MSIAPCRQYDSRNSTPLPQATPRTVTLTGGACNIPSGAAAISANISVFNITGATGNGVFKVGIPSGSSISWLNYPPFQGQIDNAGIVPVDGSGDVQVEVFQGAGSVDFVVDVNGYYTLLPFGVRTVVVSPVGTSAQNGTVLLNALAGITTASATNPWLLKIEPGIYDIGNSTLAMKPYVDIEGSGELSTTILSSGAVTNIAVLAASNAELRFLSVSSSSSGPNFSVAYTIQSAASRLTHVTITANETGGGAATGISANGANLIVDHVTVTATATSGGQSIALGSTGSSVLVGNSTLGAVGGGFQSNGLSIDGSTVNLQNSVVTATGAPNNLGISIFDLHGGATVLVDTSQITASTHTIFGSGVVSAFVGASKLSGGSVAGGTSTCAGVYDGSYVFFPSTCP